MEKEKGEAGAEHQGGNTPDRESEAKEAPVCLQPGKKARLCSVAKPRRMLAWQGGRPSNKSVITARRNWQEKVSSHKSERRGELWNPQKDMPLEKNSCARGLEFCCESGLKEKVVWGTSKGGSKVCKRGKLSKGEKVSPNRELR